MTYICMNLAFENPQLHNMCGLAAAMNTWSCVVLEGWFPLTFSKPFSSTINGCCLLMTCICEVIMQDMHVYMHVVRYSTSRTTNTFLWLVRDAMLVGKQPVFSHAPFVSTCGKNIEKHMQSLNDLQQKRIKSRVHIQQIISQDPMFNVLWFDSGAANPTGFRWWLWLYWKRLPPSWSNSRIEPGNYVTPKKDCFPMLLNSFERVRSLTMPCQFLLKMLAWKQRRTTAPRRGAGLGIRLVVTKPSSLNQVTGWLKHQFLARRSGRSRSQVASDRVSGAGGPKLPKNSKYKHERIMNEFHPPSFQKESLDFSSQYYVMTHDCWWHNSGLYLIVAQHSFMVDSFQNQARTAFTGSIKASRTSDPDW